MGTIENVKLVEIREGDFSQKYEFDPSQQGDKHKWMQGVLWLSGWNRAAQVKVGDKGKLVFKTGPNYGLWFFERDDSLHPIKEKNNA